MSTSSPLSPTSESGKGGGGGLASSTNPLSPGNDTPVSNSSFTSQGSRGQHPTRQRSATTTASNSFSTPASSSCPTPFSAYSPDATPGPAAPPPRRRRMKKRVYVIIFLLCVLVFYSVYSEGRVGIIASIKALGLLIGLWLSVWYLFLRDVPAFRTFFSVIFQVTEDADKRPRAPRRVVVYE